MFLLKRQQPASFYVLTGKARRALWIQEPKCESGASLVAQSAPGYDQTQSAQNQTAALPALDPKTHWMSLAR